MDPATSGALSAAVESEKESLHAYLRFARQTRDPGGKDMFIRLATDEFEHMRLLKTWQGELRESGEWRPAAIPAGMVEKLVPKLSDRSLRIRGTSGQTDLSALQTALELETRAVRFYSEQAAAVAGPGRQVFSRLAEVEQAHTELIQAEIDSIQQDGFWFSTREFTLESER